MLTGLHTLDISWNDLGPVGASSLAPCLMMLIELKSLDLSVNGMGPSGASSLAPSLLRLTGLRSLNLCLNYMGYSASTLLESSLLASLSHLRELRLQPWSGKFFIYIHTYTHIYFLFRSHFTFHGFVGGACLARSRAQSLKDEVSVSIRKMSIPRTN